MDIIKLKLQFFADESGETVAATEPASTGTGDTGNASPAADAQPSFDEVLANPAYKAEYDKRVGKAISSRFKKAKAAEDRSAALEPMVERLASKYGIAYAPGMDLAGLNQAMDDDDSYFEAEAERRNMSVESVKQVMKLERDNKRMREAEEARQRDAQWNQIVQQWDACEQIHPGVTLDSEMQNNPAFGRMVAAGVPADAAYKACHMDEIMGQGMRYAVQQTQAQTLKAVASGATRPRELGMGGNPSVSTAIDPAHLTKAQREDIRRKVQRGEKISF